MGDRRGEERGVAPFDRKAQFAFDAGGKARVSFQRPSVGVRRVLEFAHPGMRAEVQLVLQA